MAEVMSSEDLECFVDELAEAMGTKRGTAKVSPKVKFAVNQVLGKLPSDGYTMKAKGSSLTLFCRSKPETWACYFAVGTNFQVLDADVVHFDTRTVITLKVVVASVLVTVCIRGRGFDVMTLSSAVAVQNSFGAMFVRDLNKELGKVPFIETTPAKTKAAKGFAQAIVRKTQDRTGDWKLCVSCKHGEVELTCGSCRVAFHVLWTIRNLPDCAVEAASVRHVEGRPFVSSAIALRFKGDLFTVLLSGGKAETVARRSAE